MCATVSGVPLKRCYGARVTFAIMRCESEEVRQIWKDGEPTGIFLTLAEADILLVCGVNVRRERIERLFSDSPNRLAMLNKLPR